MLAAETAASLGKSHVTPLWRSWTRRKLTSALLWQLVARQEEQAACRKGKGSGKANGHMTVLFSIVDWYDKSCSVLSCRMVPEISKKHLPEVRAEPAA